MSPQLMLLGGLVLCVLALLCMVVLWLIMPCGVEPGVSSKVQWDLLIPRSENAKRRSYVRTVERTTYSAP